MALAGGPRHRRGAADPWRGGGAWAANRLSQNWDRNQLGIGIEAQRGHKVLCGAFGKPLKITRVGPSGPPVMKPLEALVWALTGSIHSGQASYCPGYDMPSAEVASALNGPEFILSRDCMVQMWPTGC